MADHSGKAQFFVAFRCAAEHEAEGDRVFGRHAAWMEGTHPKEGDEALLQYTVSKSRDDDGNVQYLLAEIYETTAGIDNHRRLARENQDDWVQAFFAFADKCDTIGWDDADVVHSLW